jgi:mannose-1-phosphate guanylyltransferase
MIHRVRKAFVLGAGLGNRLRPLTNLWPKPLLPIFGKPLITFALDHLRQAGIESCWVNAHHLAEKFSTEFPRNEYRGMPLEVVREVDLLETGGGIKNIEHRIGDEVFIVYSGDILTDLPLDRLVEEHFTKRNDVTLALRTTELARGVHWRPDTGRVIDLLGALGSGEPGDYDFAGISVWNPSVFSRISIGTKISFVPILIEWMKSGGQIGGVPLQESRWFNLGSRKEYLSAHRVMAQDHWVPDYLRNSPWPTQVHPSAQVSPGCKIVGGSYVGARCLVEDDVHLVDSVLFPDSFIPRGTRLHSCIVAGVKLAAGDFLEADFV